MGSRCLVLALAWLTATGLVASADEASRHRAGAKSLSDLGAKAFAHQDYRGALEHFRDAYRVFPSPNLHFNLGLALEKLGEDREASAEFKAFLRDATGAPPTALAQARALLETLERRLAAQAPRLAEPPPLPSPSPPSPSPPSPRIEPPPRLPAEPPPKTEARAARGRLHGRQLLGPVVIGALALVSLGVGVSLDLWAQSIHDGLITSCGGRWRCDPGDAAKQAAVAEGQAVEGAAIGLLAIGSLLAAADVVWWVTLGRSKGDHRAWVAPSGAGLAAGGAF